MTWQTRVGVVAVHAYQLAIGPFTGGACRFEPSCSTYAIQALEEHGLWRGLGLALSRVARCHPFARPGIDPVPPRTSGRGPTEF
jgi:putative membrane protein insertion efficiency factor